MIHYLHGFVQILKRMQKYYFALQKHIFKFEFD